MSLITDIKEQISDLTTFKHISSAFTEAAAVKLASIRRAFIRNDRFFNEITHIYNLVQINAQKLELPKEKKVETSFKKLTVALTSNQRFFGNLNSEIMINFLLYANKNKTEKLVIGSTGQSYIRGANYKEIYQSMNFRSDLPNDVETETFLSIIKDYSVVTIYYPKFVSIIKQEVGSIDITGKIPLSPDVSKIDLEQELNLIFEPELSKIVKFFDLEVRAILFKRVLLETDLARTAARLLSMSQAEERTDYEVKLKKSELRKVTKAITNAQLLETFSGIKKWKHALSDRQSQKEMKNKVLFFENAN